MWTSGISCPCSIHCHFYDLLPHPRPACVIFIFHLKCLARTRFALAFTFGTREHKNLDDLLALLQPFPIRRVYTDNNFAYHKRIPAEQHTTGKRNTQKIERDHLTNGISGTAQTYFRRRTDCRRRIRPAAWETAPSAVSSNVWHRG